MKKTAPISQLCRSLPAQFAEIFEMTMRLAFADEPDYQRYITLMDEAVAEIGGDDQMFDWEGIEQLIVPWPDLPKRLSPIEMDLPVGRLETARVEFPDLTSEPDRQTGQQVEGTTSEITPEVVKKPTEKKEKKKKKREGKEDDEEPICQMCNVF
jgi:hypothetical protein